MQEKKTLKNLKIKKLSIVGVIPSFAFQRAKYCALELHRKLPQRFPLPEIVGLLELDWSEKLQEWRQTMGREYWCLRRPVAVFFDDRFIGSDVELIKMVTIGNILMDNIPRKNMSSMRKLFQKDYIAYLKKSKRIYCYLDICVDGVYAGTLTFQLYSDIVPRTCENFKTLCLGSRGPLLSYRGSRIHRIVKRGWLQGGDVQYKTGGGGFSIFCDPLEDECFGISHDRRGVLSMASGGRHRNGSQFFITLQPSTWMDTNFVAFGQLVEGVRVLRKLEDLETFYECPLQKVEIKSCGKLDLQDVEDVDAMYREEPMPAKKRKKIETISEQVVRLIMEALTAALQRKERSPDILDEGDVPSKMNLQLYFQGFYSLPESVLEETAAYLRKLRRQLLRVVKPSATEIVEVIMYDLLMAVLTRMMTLDDVRETIGHDLYERMVSGINLKLELCKKSYVKRLIDQIVSTATSMIDLVSRKLHKMKGMSENLKKFQDRMQGWVQSFVLQETFRGDNYFIAERPVLPKPPEEPKEFLKRQGRQCCEEERKKKEEELKAKLRAKYTPSDLCCLGSKLKLDESEINLLDFFGTCAYDLRRVKKEEKERMPLLDLIEISRFKLRWIRKQENRVKDQERLCAEKKIRRWMSEVVYTPETSWLKDTIFPKDCLVFDHVEEIMYGAMTAGLLEMYYFMEQYLKLCGGKRKMLVTRTIYPEEEDKKKRRRRGSGYGSGDEGEDEYDGEDEDEDEDGGKGGRGRRKKKGAGDGDEVPDRPCPCGHPCCECPFDPGYKEPPPPPPSMEGDEEEGEGGYYLGEEEGSGQEGSRKSVGGAGSEGGEPVGGKTPCASDETLVDLNALMAEKVSLKPEEIDINSFKWLKPFILEQGCDMRTDFATQVHKWLEGEQLNLKGFISKQSLPTRASLLSLSLSLAELIKQEDKLKDEVRNFIYDLWDLYFEEMFKEAYLEFPRPPEPETGEDEIEGEGKGERGEDDEELGGGGRGDAGKGTEGRKGVGTDEDDECKKIMEQTPDFDFEKYCRKMEGGDEPDEPEEPVEELPVPVARSDSLLDEKPHAAPPPEKETAKKESLPKETPAKEETPEEKPPQTEEPPPKEQEEEPPEEDEVDREQEEHKTRFVEAEVAEVAPPPPPPLPEAKAEQPVKKKKSPIIIEELVDVPSGEEIRNMPPYVLPFWVKFLTELTKQALGAIAKLSRLPRRLYFQSDSEVAFDDKMKEWFEFNAFNPQPTKGREIMEYITLHHKSLTNLEETARSYLKKKKLSGLLNRCTRFSSADDVAEEIVADVVNSAMFKSEEEETLELFVSSVLSTAIASSPARSQASIEEEEEEDSGTIETDKMESRADEEGAEEHL